MMTVGGCAESDEVAIPGTLPSPALPAPMGIVTECPTGHCDPENPNGQGIYAVEQGNYCFLDSHKEERYCPEAFIQSATGVMLAMRVRPSPFEMRNVPVSAVYRALPEAAPQAVELLQVGTDPLHRTRLQLRYRLGGVEKSAAGNELSQFTFSMTFLEPVGSTHEQVEYDFKLQPAPSPTSEGGLDQYTLLYHPGHGDALPWLRHCDQTGDDKETSVVSFLPRERVSGMSAYVTRDDDVLTVACRTGAIVTCMNWGYTPWQEQSGEPDKEREYAFGSCLQAKRAAYFVRYGDLKSYTLNGTPIRLKDAYGIKEESITNLEAVWSPGGATCLNREYRRRMEVPINDVAEVPTCGAPPPPWSEEGKLATALAP
jgi:hypothetical protein